MTSLPNTRVLSTREMILELIATPFRALGAGMMYLTTHNSRAIAVEKISKMTDEDFAAMGTTRVEAIQRVLGRHF